MSFTVRKQVWGGKGAVMGLLKKIGIGLLILAIAAGYLFFHHFPVTADKQMNVVLPHDPYPVSEEGRALHESLRVADLHSDMLLWKRNPMERQERGHTDLPRLREGGIAVQVFASVTKSPDGQNYESNTGDTDRITLLAQTQLWPLDTWDSIYNRAKYHARRLKRIEKRSKGQFIIARTKSDLRDALEAREEDKDVLVGILATEGGHPLEGEIGNLDRLYEEGYRMIGLHHFFDNELGGSLHGVSGAGLSAFGRDVVARLEERDMMIDVAHSSHQVVRDVLAMTDKPLVVSHTGIYSACPAKRNIPDELMSEIAARGGLIGIGYWEDVTCDASPEGVARVIFIAAQKFGADQVALGSDYDGAITAEFDTSELAVITDRLLALGMSEENIRKVMGENAIRFFGEHLPED